jgi:hypothetical protein
MPLNTLDGLVFLRRQQWRLPKASLWRLGLARVDQYRRYLGSLRIAATRRCTLVRSASATQKRITEPRRVRLDVEHLAHFDL